MTRHHREYPEGATRAAREVIARIREARKEAGISQELLAASVGLGRNAYANTEAGRTQDFGVGAVILIARELDLTAASLLGDNADQVRREGREQAARRLGILEGSLVWRLMTADEANR